MRFLLTSRRLFVAALCMSLVVMFASGLAVLQWRATCHAVVDNREGQRAMWLYALEITEPSPRSTAFAAELDARIPALRCAGWLGTHAEPRNQTGE